MKYLKHVVEQTELCVVDTRHVSARPPQTILLNRSKRRNDTCPVSTMSSVGFIRDPWDAAARRRSCCPPSAARHPAPCPPWARHAASSCCPGWAGWWTAPAAGSRCPASRRPPTGPWAARAATAAGTRGPRADAMTHYKILCRVISLTVTSVYCSLDCYTSVDARQQSRQWWAGRGVAASGCRRPAPCATGGRSLWGLILDANDALIIGYAPQ